MSQPKQGDHICHNGMQFPQDKISEEVLRSHTIRIMIGDKGFVSRTRDEVNQYDHKSMHSA